MEVLGAVMVRALVFDTVLKTGMKVMINISELGVTDWMLERVMIDLDVAELQAEIVEVEIDGVAIYRPFGEFRRGKSYCHLYGAHGQRQAYF
ncbi:hypothetical protein TNCV_3348541 [Trichonephila clavipes]|nr:hypothetical protein TNCV_3348541 [Trichonephila clavipes]